jgi:hypothetical protein
MFFVEQYLAVISGYFLVFLPHKLLWEGIDKDMPLLQSADE